MRPCPVSFDSRKILQSCRSSSSSGEPYNFVPSNSSGNSERNNTSIAPESACFSHVKTTHSSSRVVIVNHPLAECRSFSRPPLLPSHQHPAFSQHHHHRPAV